jgi:citrate lyase subunit beta/citryl-CoA lyase
VWVRINRLAQREAQADLAAVVQNGLSGIVVPKIDGPDDIADLSLQLDGLEIRAGLSPGTVRILAVATETAQSLFRLGDYRAVNARLYGLTWGAEDLAACLGASTNRAQDGSFTLPYQLARTLCLAGARAAGVLPVETAVMDFRNTDAVFHIASTARKDGFFGMMAIHPAQVVPINRAFTPSQDECRSAARVVDVFAAAGNPGVVALDGRMLDLPHLRQAENTLALAKMFPAAL